MTQDEMKKMVAEAALEYVEAGSIVGVGTGSTANFFIDGLAAMKGRFVSQQGNHYDNCVATASRYWI